LKVFNENEMMGMRVKRRKYKKIMFFFQFIFLWSINFLSFEDKQLWNEEMEASVGYKWMCTIGIMFVNLDGSYALMHGI